jgi:hypothetical protein
VSRRRRGARRKNINFALTTHAHTTMRGFFIRSHYCVIVCEVPRKSWPFFAVAPEKDAGTELSFFSVGKGCTKL